MKTIRIVFVTIPREEAQTMARQLVEERYAACVSIVPKINSIYSWDGKIQEDEESLLIIKTTQGRFDALMEHVKEHHPYEVPEIIGFPLTEALPEYVSWVRRETDSGTGGHS